MNRNLKTIKLLILDKVEKKIDDEDGEFYWVKKDYIPGSDIDTCEVILNDCAKVFRLNHLPNLNEKYRFYSRLVAHIRMDFLPKSLTEVLSELVTHEKEDE